MEKVSLVMTVFNERDSVGRFFAALPGFSRLPDEIVIVDGGSTDDTVALARSHIADAPVPVTLIEERRCNIARGRNIAIRNAGHELLALTDMGCRIPGEWLERLIEPFERDPSLEFAGGYYGHHCETPLQHCFDRLHRKENLATKTFYPSSRSLAMRRHVWEAVGGYPELMTVGEDMYFDLRVREKGFRETVAPEAKVYWETARTYKGLFRKYYRYARSAGAVCQQPKVYGFYATAYALFALWLLLSQSVSPAFLGVFALQGVAYSWLRIFRKKAVREALDPGSIWRYHALTLVLDTATVLGFLSGLALFVMGKRESWTPPPESD